MRVPPSIDALHAAYAEGLTPHALLALGTDTAGSGRVPAALNGVVGLKPSLGAVPTRGVVLACPNLNCNSIFARSVTDAWRGFMAMVGEDAADPWSRAIIMSDPREAAPLRHIEGFFGHRGSRPFGLPGGRAIVVCGRFSGGARRGVQARRAARCDASGYAAHPRRPGLLRVGAADGAAIVTEGWALPAHNFGRFVADISAPLCIGTLNLADGSTPKRFRVEPAGLESVEDITRCGGWHAFMARS